ncbi:MAG: 23S rRNA (uracil(1939)-C(5))-methyltransferase RlmD [Balneolaceae bacterium]
MVLKKGSEVELDVESAAYKGKGVARHDGLAVFIPGTAPGDKILARIVKRKKSYCEAKKLKLLEPSPRRIEPRCSHADTCGGCTWQHLQYKDQLEIKEQQVRDHMERIGGLDPSVVQPIIGCDKEFYYRNKMEYSFGTRKWLTEEEIRRDEYVDDSGFAAGLHAPGRYDKILNLNECHLQDPVSYQILDEVRQYCIEHKIPAYDTVHNTGFMRNLVIRSSHYTEDLMVNLVTYSSDPETIQTLSNHLTETFPEITTLVNNINDRTNPTAVGRYENILYGPGYITDSIGRHTFKIHANAFFQTNTPQAEKLYGIARKFAQPHKEDLLFDLYCGVGTMSLFMSDAVKKVIGIELSEVALQNARFNANENQVDNADFVLGDMKDTFHDSLLHPSGRPDCILTDPPRAGMHPDVVKQLCDLRVSRLVYVSCNPSTMARDLKKLKKYYHIRQIQPVDMFPQTYHIEAVAGLFRKTE